MVWGYLTEFWNAVSDVGDYPIQWFQSVGNAVAGAIGGLFEDLTHHFYDVFYLARWFLSNLGEMLSIMFTPLFWVFNFIKGFFASANSSIGELGLEVPSIDLMSNNVGTFFSIFPHFSLLVSGIAGALGILVLFFIIKKFIMI